MSWQQFDAWWIDELGSDPAYETVVTPMLLDRLQPKSEALYLDLGAGEGRVMRAVGATGARVHGVDLNRTLARIALAFGPVVVGELPDLSFLRDRAYDGVYCVLTLEHIEDEVAFFAETARVTKPRGVLALVCNHPTWTAPKSTPITDDDGEVLWRPGEYFESGATLERAGDSTVTFHHRSTATLLTAAAEAGWSLERMTEAPHHEYWEQGGIPRLLACRWRRIR